MVKVNGPMMSMSASGTLNKTVTFSIWKGRPYARTHVIPSNPKSDAQTGRRAMMRFLSQNWAALTTAEKATWETLADQLVALPFNAYVSFNMKLWHNFKPPTQETPPGLTNAGSDNVLTAAIWEENRIKLSLAGTALNEAWGIVVYAEPGATTDITVARTILIELETTIAAHTIYWTPPTVGQWTFDTSTFSDDGQMVAPGGPETAAAP